MGLFAALPALSIDMSAPTLALLPAALATSETIAGLTLSLFMAGFALGQVASGHLSDRYGRRPVLLSGLACFTLAGIACSVSVSGPMLAAARMIQGCGAGACSVIAFAMVQDLFTGDAARAKMSFVTVIFGVVPVLAPALGAVLSDLIGWRSVHSVLAAGGAVLLIVASVLVAESRTFGAGGTATAEARVLPPLWRDGPFVRTTLSNALSYAGTFIYIAGAPVVIMGQMGFPAGIFAGVFACTASALTAGAWTSGHLSRRGIAAADLVYPSLIASTVATGGLAAAGFAGVTSGWILLPLLLVVLFARGMTAPNLQQLALSRQRARAGKASAAVGVAQLLAGAAGSALDAFLLPVFGLAAVTVLMALFATGSLAVWWRAEQAR